MRAKQICDRSTLIEALLVVSVTDILMALLVPAILVTRGFARRVT